MFERVPLLLPQKKKHLDTISEQLPDQLNVTEFQTSQLQSEADSTSESEIDDLLVSPTEHYNFAKESQGKANKMLGAIGETPITKRKLQSRGY